MKRVLFVSNTPFSRSSYGIVTNNMLKAMPDYKWFVLSRLWKEPPMAFGTGNTRYLLMPSAEGDSYCFDSLARTINNVQPDTVISIGDIGIQTHYATIMNKRIKNKSFKWFPYIPCDTDFINYELQEDLVNIESEADKIISMSEFGEKTFKKYGVDSKFIYHGVDNEVFSEAKLTQVSKWRKQLGRRGDFVVFTNSNNQHRKMLPRLMEAFKKADISNKFLLLHTDLMPTNVQTGGWDVKGLVRHYGISDCCGLTQANQFPGWRTSFDVRRMNKLYNCADVFVFSGNEGFGLPVCEAQATLTPVIAGRQTTMPELVPDDNLVSIKDYWYNVRTRYGMVDTDLMARKLEEVAALKRSERKNRVKDMSGFSWSSVCEKWREII